MVRKALEVGRGLDEGGTRKAVELLETLRVANELYTNGDQGAREMNSLQQHITSWVTSRVDSGGLACGWERPPAASNTIPAHVKKMARRYDMLRAALLRTAMAPRSGLRGSGGGLASVAESDEERLASARSGQASARGLPSIEVYLPAQQANQVGSAGPLPPVENSYAELEEDPLLSPHFHEEGGEEEEESEEGSEEEEETAMAEEDEEETAGGTPRRRTGELLA